MPEPENSLWLPLYQHYGLFNAVLSKCLEQAYLHAAESNKDKFFRNHVIVHDNVFGFRGIR